MSQRRKLAAILLSDIPDFPQTMRDEESAALAQLRHRNAIVDAAVRKHGGRRLKAVGDSYRALFDSAVSAVDCALLAAELTRDYNERDGRKTPLNLRMAVHLGELLVDGEDVFGDGLQVAAGLLALTPRGRICVSSEVYAFVRQSSGGAFSSFGRHDIAGAGQPVEVYACGAPAAPEEKEGAQSPQVSLTAAPEAAAERQEPVRVPDPMDLEIPEDRRAADAAPAKARRPPPRRVTDAILSISHRDLMTRRLGGLTVLERQVFSLHRAGIRRLWITAEKPEHEQLRGMRKPKGLEVFWMSDRHSLRELARPPYATLSADHLVRGRVLREILSQAHENPISFQDPARTGDFDKRGILQIIPYGSDSTESFVKKMLGPDDSFLLQELSRPGPALDWLMEEARKPTDSFMARHFDRRISLAATRLLLDTEIHPNQMTVLSVALGALGALLFAAGSYPFLLAGALIVWLHTLLDGCDGELARLRFQESRLGGEIDFWGDNIVHGLLFASIGVGQFRLLGDRSYLLLGGIAAAAAALSAAAVYQFSVEKAREAPAGPLFRGLEGLEGETRGSLAGLIARIEQTLSQRDFIYLLLALAAAGQLRLFLIAAAVGTPLFLVTFLSLRLVSRLKKS